MFWRPQSERWSSSAVLSPRPGCHRGLRRSRPAWWWSGQSPRALSSANYVPFSFWRNCCAASPDHCSHSFQLGTTCVPSSVSCAYRARRGSSGGYRSVRPKYRSGTCGMDEFPSSVCPSLSYQHSEAISASRPSQRLFLRLVRLRRVDEDAPHDATDPPTFLPLPRLPLRRPRQYI